MDAIAQAPAHPKTPAASDVLEELIDTLPRDTVSVGELIDALDTRAHGVLLLILALPMCIPNIPGISTIFGVLMLAPALQMLFGQRKVWLPKGVRAWRFKRSGLETAVRRTVPTLRKIEHFILPRLSPLTRFPVTLLVGFQALIMALILILPLWGANFTPGITVTMMALALLQRDGLLMLLSVPAALGSIAWVYFTFKFSLDAMHYLFNWLTPFFQSWFGG